MKHSKVITCYLKLIDQKNTFITECLNFMDLFAHCPLQYTNINYREATRNVYTLNISIHLSCKTTI